MSNYCWYWLCVGLPLSIALLRYNNVTLVDIEESKGWMVNKGHSLLEEKAIHKALKNRLIYLLQWMGLLYVKILK